jgi:hypothetical protein
MSESAQMLAEAIQATEIADVLKASGDDSKVHLICRVHDKRAWCAVVEYVLARKGDWSEHICQQYFMRNGKLVYGWNFIINSKDITAAVKDAVKLIKNGTGVVNQIAPAGRELTSFPLVGYSSRRNAKTVFDPRQPGPSRGGPSHKGAYTVGSGE